MNRYTQLNQAKFDPLTMQEMSIAPTYMRQQEDALSDEADELGLFTNDSLDPDKAATSAAISDYKNELDAYSSKLAREGFSQLNKKDLKTLASKKRALESSDGLLGRAKMAKAAYSNNVKNLQDLYSKGKIDQQTLNAGLAKSLGDYGSLGGATSGASYTSFNPALDPGIAKIVNDTSKNIANSKQIETEGTGTYQDSQGNIFDKTTNTKLTPKNMIAFGVTNKIMSNPEAIARLQQQSELGLLKNKKGEEISVPDYIKQIANDAQLEHAIYKTKESVKSGVDPGNSKKKDKSKFADREPFIMNKTYNREFGEEYIKEYDTEYTRRFTKSSSSGLYNYVVGAPGAANPKTIEQNFNDLPTTKQTKITSIYKKLVNEGTLKGSDTMFSPKSYNAISEKLKEINDFRKFKENPVVYPYNEAYSESRVKQLLSTGQHSTFYDLNGKPALNPFIDTEDSDWKSPKKSEIYVEGELDPTNSLNLDINNDARNNMAVPMLVKINGKEYLMARPDAELASDQYKVDVAVNKIYTNIIDSAFEPYKFTGGKNDDTYVINYNPESMRYMVSVNGSAVQPLSSTEIKKFISEEGLY